MINAKINKATIFTLAERTHNSGGETTSSRRIQLIANGMFTFSGSNNKRLILHSDFVALFYPKKL
jgi:hypothetical protein